MNKNLLILGAGQYGTVVKEIAEEMDCFDKIAFLDDKFDIGKIKDNYREQSIGKLSDYENFKNEYTYAICSIGNADIRKAWTEKLTEAGYTIPVLASARAYISKSAQLRYGCVIEPFAVVHANAVLGIATFVSAGAVVDHNSVVSDYCHIKYNAVVMSGAKVLYKTQIQPCEVVGVNPTEDDCQ